MESKKSLVFWTFLVSMTILLVLLTFLMSSTECSLLLVRSELKVFLAPEKYFPFGHRGVYHTVSNTFFLNKRYMEYPGTLMSVMRHEGWHAAQDCMAGTIKNSMIAIIMPEEDVPMIWQELANAHILKKHNPGKKKQPGQVRLKV